MKNEKSGLCPSLGLLDHIFINIDPDSLRIAKAILDEPNVKKFFADEELMLTAQAFFDHNLNLIQTSQHLIVHRNTLVYRLEKIKKMLGLDIRTFEDAVTLNVMIVLKRTEIKRKRHTSRSAKLETLK